MIDLVVSCKSLVSCTIRYSYIRLLLIVVSASVPYLNDISVWAGDKDDLTPHKKRSYEGDSEPSLPSPAPASSLDLSSSAPPSSSTSSISLGGISDSFSETSSSSSSSSETSSTSSSGNGQKRLRVAGSEEKEGKYEQFPPAIGAILDQISKEVLKVDESYKTELPKLLLSLQTPLQDPEIFKDTDQTQLSKTIKSILKQKLFPGPGASSFSQIETQIDNITKNKRVNETLLRKGIKESPLTPIHLFTTPPDRQWVDSLTLRNITNLSGSEMIQWNKYERDLVQSIYNKLGQKNAALLRIGLIKKSKEHLTYFDQLVPLVFISGYAKASEGKLRGLIQAERKEGTLSYYYNLLGMKDIIYLDSFNTNKNDDSPQGILDNGGEIYEHFTQIIPNELLSLMFNAKNMAMLMDAEQAAIRTLMVDRKSVV